jgi:NAD(P)-dependent dehydrogenase (short-subunit alcohol dehydrogenase family)
VVLADINDDALAPPLMISSVPGHQAVGVTGDVSGEAQVASMLNDAVATFGRLDTALNNAGIPIAPSDAPDEPAESYDRVNAINLRGSCFATGVSSVAG